MGTFWTAVGLATAVLCTSTASASTISYSSRPIVSTANASAEDYRQDWLDALAVNPVAPAGYGDATFTEFFEVSNQSQGASTQNIGGVGRNLSEYFKVDFVVDALDAGSWDLRFQNDFGYGGAVFLNGVAVAFKNFDLAGSDPLEIFYITSLLSAGLNTIEIYGQEGCCDGYQYGQFRKPGTRAYETFSEKDGLPAVPLPPAIILMLSGLIAFVAVGRQRKSASCKIPV